MFCLAAAARAFSALNVNNVVWLGIAPYSAADGIPAGSQTPDQTLLIAWRVLAHVCPFQSFGVLHGPPFTR